MTNPIYLLVAALWVVSAIIFLLAARTRRQSMRRLARAVKVLPHLLDDPYYVAWRKRERRHCAISLGLSLSSAALAVVYIVLALVKGGTP